MARTRVTLRLPVEDPLRKYYVLPECGVPVLGAGTDGFVVRAVAQRSGYSDALKFVRDSVNDSEREIQALQAIGRHSHVVELFEGGCMLHLVHELCPSLLSRVARDLGGPCAEGLQEQVSQLPLGW